MADFGQRFVHHQITKTQMLTDKDDSEAAEENTVSPPVFDYTEEERDALKKLFNFNRLDTETDKQ